MDVLIETADGKTFELEIWYFDTFLEIKKKIHQHHNIPVDHRVLTFNGVVLSDDKNAGDYPIVNGSRLRLVENQEKKTITVKVVPVNSTKKLPVEINPHDKVSELRKEIQKLEAEKLLHIPQPDFFFIWKQSVMEEDMTFRWHGVRPGDTIELFNGYITKATD